MDPQQGGISAMGDKEVGSIPGVSGNSAAEREQIGGAPVKGGAEVVSEPTRNERLVASSVN